MTEPIDVAIQVALYARLTGATGTLGSTPRAAPFVDPPYVPVTGTIYLDVQFLRAEPDHFGLSFDNADILSGIMQVDVVAPLGPGGLPALRLASLVKERFAIGTPGLTANGKSIVIVNTPSIATAVRDGPWVRFPVSIPYRLIT